MSLKRIQIPFAENNALRRYVSNPGNGKPSCDWFKRHEKTKGKKPDSCTHFLLRGGKYEVDPECNDEFLWNYAISVQQGILTSVVERRTEFFRYHVDMDFAQLTEVSLQDMPGSPGLRSYLLVFQETLHKFFPFSPNVFFECSINSAATKLTMGSDGKTQLTKTGFHVIFHHIWVNADQALSIRAYLLCALRKAFGERKEPFFNLWEDVVDESIYLANGLRMNTATKYHRCKSCGGKARSAKQTLVAPPLKLPSSSVASAASITLTSSPSTPSTPSTPSVDLKKLLRTSSSAGLIDRPSSQEAAVAVAVTDAKGACDDCGDGKGYVFEGRPYFLRATWDYKCDAIERLVLVPREPSDDTPVYKAPANLFDFSIEANREQKAFGVASNVERCFWAMPMPYWLPFEDDAEKEDGLDLEPMDSAPLANPAPLLMSVPLQDLLLYGDPFEVVNGLGPWELTRRLHNTLRLTSIRIPPALDSVIRAKFTEDVAALKNGDYPQMDPDLNKIVPFYVRPDGAPPYDRIQNAIKRRALPISYDSNGHRIERLDELKLVDSDNKVFEENEKLLLEVEQFIRFNVGMRVEEPKAPYAEIAVTAIYHNVVKTGSPKHFYVRIDGFGSSFCQNIAGNHNSNGIYFRIDSKGITQKCFCRCKTTARRLSGLMCKDFSSVCIPLPVELKKHFFGTKTEKSTYFDKSKVAEKKAVVKLVEFDHDEILKNCAGYLAKPITHSIPLLDESQGYEQQAAFAKEEVDDDVFDFAHYKKAKRDREFMMHGLLDPEDRVKQMLKSRKVDDE